MTLDSSMLQLYNTVLKGVELAFSRVSSEVCYHADGPGRIGRISKLCQDKVPTAGLEYQCKAKFRRELRCFHWSVRPLERQCLSPTQSRYVEVHGGDPAVV